MKRFFIWAYENVFHAENGIEDWFLFEGSFKDACDLGLDMSYDLIISHPSIMEVLRQQNITVEDDMAYEVWEVRSDAPSFTMLNKMDLSPEEYIKKFCIK